MCIERFEIIDQNGIIARIGEKTKGILAVEVFLVGGAVRDRLMGLKPRERDWVVVGATVDMMLAAGYTQVGRDFPVFLHPKTKEEYALARTERKSGQGYKGFVVHAAPSVRLEEDLLRRDLTINAIAQSMDGTLVDPFYGVKDIEQQCLRHVSSAFEEDPLRVVRLARFQARFWRFVIHPETLALCKKMARSGELSTLTPERVWAEWVKVTGLEKPWVFIEALHTMGAWEALFPLFAQPSQDILYVKKASTHIKGAELFCLWGLYLESKTQEEALEGMALPKAIKALSRLVHSIYVFYPKWDKKGSESAESLLKALYAWDVFRRLERWHTALELLINALEDQVLESTLSLWRQLATQVRACDYQSLSAQEKVKHSVAEALYKKRLQIIQYTLALEN